MINNGTPHLNSLKSQNRRAALGLHQKMKIANSVLLRLFITNNLMYNTGHAPSTSLSETQMIKNGSMISKEQKLLSAL